MVVPLVFSDKQAEYIREHIGYPIIPDGKDLEMVSTIKDLIASAREQAIYKKNVEQKAQAELETLAKFIIARHIKNREWFHREETENIMRRVIKCDINERTIQESYWSIVITHPKLCQQRFVVRYDGLLDIYQAWATHEGMPFPWRVLGIVGEKEPFLEFAADLLERMTEEWKDA